MTGFLRSATILAVTALVFTLTVQAQSLDPSAEECLKPNEEYNPCGTACPTTCEDFLTSNLYKPCTHQCVPGCACQKGFVRASEEPNSPCVKAIECRR